MQQWEGVQNPLVRPRGGIFCNIRITIFTRPRLFENTDTTWSDLILRKKGNLIVVFLYISEHKYYIAHLWYYWFDVTKKRPWTIYHLILINVPWRGLKHLWFWLEKGLLEDFQNLRPLYTNYVKYIRAVDVDVSVNGRFMAKWLERKGIPIPLSHKDLNIEKLLTFCVHWSDHWQYSRFKF